MKRKSTRRPVYANQQAVIVSRPSDTSQVGGITYTQNREDSFQVGISTDSSNVTTLGLLVGQTGISLTGRQCRTLQRLLNKHYAKCGVPAFLGADVI